MAGNKNSGMHLRGQKTPGSGRAKGVKNLKTRMMDEVLENPEWKRKYESGELITPAVFWISILQDPTKSDAIKSECARNMARYLYSAMPVITETKIITEGNTEGFTINLIGTKSKDDE